jgi:hypothetical protein
MKNKIFTLMCVAISSFAIAQVAIGKNALTNTSVSLEFGPDTTEKKGIVLPWVTAATAVTGAVDGTIIYDTADHKVKYRKAGNWFDLSVDANGTANTTLQDSKTELTGAKVAIGKDGATDTTPGLLVLTDTDKAMILPKVYEPHLNIKNPTAGTMVYDTKNRQLALFNGTNWSFWKP